MGLYLRTPVPSSQARLRFAAGLSYAVNPLILPALLGAAVVLRIGGTLDEAWHALGIGLLFYAALPLAFLLWLLSRGHTASLEVRIRGRRTAPYFFGIASCIGAAVAFVLAGPATAQGWLAALALCHAVNATILLGINNRWKISVHSATLSGFGFGLLCIDLAAGPSPALPNTMAERAALYTLLLIVLPVAMVWARVHAGAHSPGEAIAGTLVGGLLMAAELLALLYLVPGLLA